MDWLKKKKKKKSRAFAEKQRLLQERGAKLLEDVIECCDGKSNPIKFFSAHQIIKATNNFSDSNRIFEMHLTEYKWYSGEIDNHPMIFLRGYYAQSYCRDIAISSMVSGHKNFMKLLGCCFELEHPVIVYNFIISISSLDLKMVVSWKKRMKIAEDIATALAYLHTAFSRPFVYRIMGLDSILYDEDGVARLCDFSCCVSIPQGEKFVKVDRIEGTYGFLEYNYLSDGTVSEITDVFAIGILMQMLLSGKERFYELRYEHQDDSGACFNGYRTFDFSRTTFARWLIKYKEEKILDEIIDPKVLEETDEVGEEELCQMKAILMLSLRCTGRTNWEIPNMVEVVKDLKNIQRSSFSSSGETTIDYARDVSFSSYASSW